MVSTLFVLLLVVVGCDVNGQPYSGASTDCAGGAGIAYDLCSDVAQSESAIEAGCNGMSDSDCWVACVEQAGNCDEALACQDACGG